MEAICSSKISVGFQRNTWRYIPEDSILHKHRCENLKSYIHETLYVVYHGTWAHLNGVLHN
jgi:hypothetical protein